MRAKRSLILSTIIALIFLPSIAQVQAIKPSSIPGPHPPPQQHIYTG